MLLNIHICELKKIYYKIKSGILNIFEKHYFVKRDKNTRSYSYNIRKKNGLVSARHQILNI